MNRFFLTISNFKNDIVYFPPNFAYQILHVLRLGDGDQVEVMNNQGWVFLVKLRIEADTRQVTGEVVNSSPSLTEPDTELALCFGLSSRDKVELILQKGTEVGVSAFFPFVSSRTLVQSVDLSPNKMARWESIIREAAEQSHRGKIPELKPPMAFAACITETAHTHSLSLLAWEKASTVQETIRQGIMSDQWKAIALFIGPEGGFTYKEIQLAKDKGCRVVSLGRRILRMETAAIVFPALVLYELEQR